MQVPQKRTSSPSSTLTVTFGFYALFWLLFCSSITFYKDSFVLLSSGYTYYTSKMLSLVSYSSLVLFLAPYLATAQVNGTAYGFATGTTGGGDAMAAAPKDIAQ